MHQITPDMQSGLNIPILPIVDVVAKKPIEYNILCAGLLGTWFTMVEGFIKTDFLHKHGIDVVIPNDSERDVIHNVIYDELCHDIIEDSFRHVYMQIISTLKSQGDKLLL